MFYLGRISYKMLKTMRSLIKYLLFLFGSVFHHNRRSKVLYYHDIDSQYTEMGTPFSLFKSHIKEIRNTGFEIVDKIEDEKNQVLIAFDDGWKGLYDHRDFFIKEDLKPTVFIAVDLIGKPGYLTKEEIIELQSIGFVFQAHSWTHTGLPDHHGDDLKHEVYDSKLELEGLFSCSFDEICFPQGRYSDEVIDICLHSGYHLMYTSIPGSYFDYIDKKLICRNLVQYAPASHIRFILTGDVPYLRKRYLKQHYTK